MKGECISDSESLNELIDKCCTNSIHQAITHIAFESAPSVPYEGAQVVDGECLREHILKSLVVLIFPGYNHVIDVNCQNQFGLPGLTCAAQHHSTLELRLVDRTV